MGVGIAKSLIQRFASVPVPPSASYPSVSVGELEEVFNHPAFLKGSESERKAFMLSSSESKYDSELRYPWDHYFGMDLSPLLREKVALDLGCFTGGRSVAWAQRYHLNRIVGVDVNKTYIEAATRFSAIKQVRAEFLLARAELLPFSVATFDAILSLDVFEHVQDLRRTLDECHRVLKKGGRLFVVFPSYWHPTAHHLDLATKLPCIHYGFSGKTLVEAYYKTLEERGTVANWYKRDSPLLKSWEKCNTINGATLLQFQRLLKNRNWKVFLHSRKPIGSVGRNISRRPGFSYISQLLTPMTFVPLLQEIMLHRITFILEKVGSAPI